ncbi:MAG: helix-turn-helix transcriptional regulator [Deltaproteobacteria bacterium]|nr:helix-turn-helix transcriptional regulator [Deltaproteobacteria bacterium]
MRSGRGGGGGREAAVRPPSAAPPGTGGPGGGGAGGGGGGGGGNEDPVRIASLSSREKQVLLLLGHGATRSEVAEMLHIGPNTVDSHRRRMMEKLGARNFRDLLRFATRIES